VISKRSAMRVPNVSAKWPTLWHVPRGSMVPGAYPSVVSDEIDRDEEAIPSTCSGRSAASQMGSFNLDNCRNDVSHCECEESYPIHEFPHEASPG
jgi:hypothetical protein